MRQSAWGGLLGLVTAGGLLLIAAWLGARRAPRVAARIRPVVGDYSTDHDPMWTSLVALAVPRRESGRPLVRRLARAGLPASPGQFRLEQLAWSALGALAGALVAVQLAAPFPGGVVLLAVTGACGGGVAREWVLSRRVRTRTQHLDDELPAAAELLAFALVAGESPYSALVRLAHDTEGVLASEFAVVVEEVRSGAPLESSLRSLAERTGSAPLSRFVDALLLAIERGTPLADAARAQAADVRAESRRRLLTLAGRKDAAMLIPVVFLILPTVVVVAIFPGLTSLRLLAP